ncbi:hypothetical protein ABZ897_52735 [Nonomuraea sp. NPDC046802]|uniref:hypothetical protein n=1 Tax=Nonomuraea sp. NPDC046802 TaxID=3154919 RepID=UPI0033FEB9B5
MRTSINKNGSDASGLNLPPHGLQDSPRRTSIKGLGIFILICILGAGLLYIDQNTSPRPAWEWKPQPFDPPVQYAFIPEDPKCPSRPPDSTEEETKPPLIACNEWRLHANFKLGKGRHDIGVPFGVGCGGRRGGVSVSDDDCTSDIQLFDAASQVQLSDGKQRSGALRITRDGHRIAYLSKKYMQFVGWDLPTAQQKAISPRVDAQALEDLSSLEISPDGKFFAVSFAGTQPRLLVTEFATGRTTTLQGFCAILGISQGASRIAAQRTCSDPNEADTVTILKRDGTVISEWRGTDSIENLSPDGKSIVEIQTDFGDDGDEYLATRNALTEKLTKKLKLHLLSEPSDAVGHAWLTNDEYIVEAETPEPGGSFGYYRVNVKSGSSRRIRDLGLNPGSTVSLGSVLARD